MIPLKPLSYRKQELRTSGYYPNHQIFYISFSSQPSTNKCQSWKPWIEWVLGQMGPPSYPVRQWPLIRLQRILQKYPVLLFGHRCKSQQHRYTASNSSECSDWRTLPNFSGCFHCCWNRTEVIPCLWDER